MTIVRAAVLSQRQIVKRKIIRQRRLLLEALEGRDLMAADAVLTWNEHLAEIVQSDDAQMGPTRTSRAFA